MGERAKGRKGETAKGRKERIVALYAATDGIYGTDVTNSANHISPMSPISPIRITGIGANS